jgi:uncharacterized membrane protein
MIERIIFTLGSTLIFISLIVGCSGQDKSYLFGSQADSEMTAELDCFDYALVKKFAHPIKAMRVITTR